jgi:hypothetical protein
MKVYDYEVDGSRHCREGVATEVRPGVLLDTFWVGGDRHPLNKTEKTSARFRFDTDDFIQVDGDHGRRDKWEQFAPRDRDAITGQHGLTVQYFTRRGATPDLATRIENAQTKVVEAKQELESAKLRLRWAQDVLRALEGPS